MNCENCKHTHTGDYGSGRFCSSKCARGFSTKSNREEINRKVSAKLAGKPGKGAAILLTTEVRNKARQARQEYYRNLPFEKVANDTRRKRIIKEQEGRCNHCNLDEWMGKPITLEMEHKDGNSQNNVRENLECICPNCHSQTSTWRGRNVALKRSKYSTEDIIAALKSEGNIHKALLSLGMASKGNNYSRMKRIVEEYEIDLVSYSGTNCGHSLLTDDDIIEISLLREQGWSYAKIGERFGVGIGTIRNAHQGRTYK